MMQTNKLRIHLLRGRDEGRKYVDTNAYTSSIHEALNTQAFISILDVDTGLDVIIPSKRVCLVEEISEKDLIEELTELVELCDTVGVCELCPEREKCRKLCGGQSPVVKLSIAKEEHNNGNR